MNILFRSDKAITKEDIDNYDGWIGHSKRCLPLIINCDGTIGVSSCYQADEWDDITDIICYNVRSDRYFVFDRTIHLMEGPMFSDTYSVVDIVKTSYKLLPILKCAHTASSTFKMKTFWIFDIKIRIIMFSSE